MTPPALSVLRVFTSWRAEPGTLAVAAVMAVSYVSGMRATWHSGRSWPCGRTACFGAGTGAVVVIGCSFLGVYGDTLFWVRAVQNVLLVMVVPMLLALGAPIRMAADLLSPAVRAPTRTASRSGSPWSR